MARAPGGGGHDLSQPGFKPFRTLSPTQFARRTWPMTRMQLPVSL